MDQQMSFLSLISNASFTVQLVMGILAIFSVISWGIIFNKWVSLNRAKTQTQQFLSAYHSNQDLKQLSILTQQTLNRTGVSQLAYAGFAEYSQLSKNNIRDISTITNNLERALNAAIDQEINQYEDKLATLASFGSVSPYIGLFGTVWGIMHAFIGLGNTGQATLASVAPGIAEALIATAIGLFVAIPAYMAYNKFSADVALLEKKMYQFGDEFINLINRRLASSNQQD